VSAADVCQSYSDLLSPTDCDRYLRLYEPALELAIANAALFALPKRHCFAAATTEQIRDRAMAWSDGSREVYLHTHLHDLVPGDRAGRGSILTASVAIGLFSDIDARGPKRNKPPETLCPTVADALAVGEEFAQLYGAVSVTIASGHGCYPILLFREPFVIRNQEDRDRLNALGRRYHDALHRIAASHTWTGAVDFCDLAKVIRLPGTVNGKDPKAPVAVRFASETTARYNISDLEEILPEFAGRNLFAAAPATSAGATGLRPTKPPQEFIDAFCQNDKKFSETWSHARTDLKDQTCSGYDMALANIGVVCGLDDNLIAGLLVENRKRFPGKKEHRSPKSYSDYLARTIAKARAAHPDDKPIGIGSLDEADGADNGGSSAPASLPASIPAPARDAAPTSTPTAASAPPSSTEPATPSLSAPAIGDDTAADSEPGDAPTDVVPTPSEVAAIPGALGTPPPTPGDKAQKELIPAVVTTITKKEVVKRVSDLLIAGHHFARDAAERLYVYKDGIYEPCDFYVRRRTQLLLEEAGLAGKWSSHHGREVVQYTMLRAKPLWEEPPLDEINLLNGILNTRDGVLRAHSPEFLSPIQIPVSYDPAATCPEWEKFVGEVFPEDTTELAWEILGDLITPDRSIQKAGLLVGEGGNGKGVFLAGCIAFVGVKNVSTVPLHKLESDRFSVSRLYGKLLNCCADLPSSDLASTSMFKALTGGDIITGERKYETSFDFKPYARLLFSANHPPRSQDASKAFFDRWIVVPFCGSFRGTARERRRNEIDAALADPKELSGVLNHALPALQRVRSSGRFTETDSTRNALTEMQQVTDPLAVWLERETVTNPIATVPIGVLLAQFNHDCAARGRPPTTQTAFGMAIRRLRPGIEVKRRGPHGDQREVYVGIGLRFDTESSHNGGSP
jgi:P4 family phage/plasmid primase-like protien